MKLEVANELLHGLRERKIILQRHVDQITKVNEAGEKVSVLLEILQRRDDTMFNDFCEILKFDGQLHVVKILLEEGVKQRCELIRYETMDHVVNRFCAFRLIKYLIFTPQ